MNHFGTLSALQPLLGSAGITMRRCRRRYSYEQLYYLESLRRNSILSDTDASESRRGYTLSEILELLYLNEDSLVSKRAHKLLMELDDKTFRPKAQRNNFISVL